MLDRMPLHSGATAILKPGKWNTKASRSTRNTRPFKDLFGNCCGTGLQQIDDPIEQLFGHGDGER